MQEIDWETEAGTVEATDAQLKRISALADRQVALEAYIEEAEASLEALKDQHRQVSEVDLPGALDEAQVVSFTTTSGRHVSVSEKLYMNIPKVRKSECAEWLQANGLRSLVQEDLTVRFERGEEARIVALQAVLEAAGYQDWTVTERMNTTAVKGAFNERMQNGEEVPLEKFGGYIRRAAVVK